jgi:phosphomevalonate kinase
MESENPKVVILLSGKRKCGKDFVSEILLKSLTNIVAFRIASPIKKQFAKDNNLDFDKLLDSSHYKENYRQEMVLWSERIRAKDPNFFLRLAIEESNAKSKPIWMLTDARRLCDVLYFKNGSFKSSKVVTIRINASQETRIKRGWIFTEGIDDKDTECGLDSYQNWDFVLQNDGSKEDLISGLKPILQLIEQNCN